MTSDYQRCLKWYGKKHPKELAAVLDNLDILLRSLDGGRKLRPFVYGFLRKEPMGVVRIGESGQGPNLAATRLYIYLDERTDVLYQLTIGDKRTQSDDIELCKGYVAQILAGAEIVEGEDDGQEEDAGGPDGDGP